MRFNSLLSVFPSFLLFLFSPPSPPFFFVASPFSARENSLLSYRREGGVRPPFPRCNAPSTAVLERGMRNVARFASEPAGSLYAAVTTSITFQRSLSVRLCERPCVSSRPTCIARHNFTDRARCLHRRENTRNLVLPPLPSRGKRRMLFFAAKRGEVRYLAEYRSIREIMFRNPIETIFPIS